jgi:histidinol-phosphate/aromatic aminotransferase/cobyric acid decarboxylase-like protein
VRSASSPAAVGVVLRAHGVHARASGQDGMRITIGTAEENDRVLAAAPAVAEAMGAVVPR